LAFVALTGVVQKWQPAIEASEIEVSFTEVGAEKGEINKEQFCAWVAMMFGEDSDAEYEEAMQQIMTA